jgi:hypothetical protein
MLEKMNLPRNIFSIIKQIYSREIPVRKGVSQGDFLSPTFVMNEIINEINSEVRHDVKVRNMDLKIRSHQMTQCF